MSEFAQLSRQLAGLVPLIGTAESVCGLVALLRHWVRIDEASLIVYPGVAPPFVAYREGATPAPPNLETFITGPFLLDPYYVAAAHDEKFGFFALAELAPKGFKLSEYYRAFYRFSGIIDECGYLVPDVLGGFANLSLARTGGRRPFARTDLRRLADFTPLVNALLGAQFAPLPQGTLGSKPKASPVKASNAIPSPAPSQGLDKGAETGLRLRLERALSEFGRVQLTRREHQTIRAILHGHTSKAIAVELGISVETVKLHRRNAYRKLGIRNQAELFSAVIDALTTGS